MQPKDIKVEYYNIQDMVVNNFTKDLLREKHKHCMKLMGIINRLSLKWRTMILNSLYLLI